MNQKNGVNLKKWAIFALLAMVVIFAAYSLFLKPTDVAVVRVAEANLIDSVRGPGLVRARIQTNVGVKAGGIVTSVLVDQGDEVKKGQLLATLDNADSQARVAAARETVKMAMREVESAEAALEKARADEALAVSNFKRDLAVFKAGYISQAAMDTADAALKAAASSVKAAESVLASRTAAVQKANQDMEYANSLLSYTKIYAMAEGIITKREKETGDAVTPGASLFRMVAPETLWVVTRVDETVVGKVKVGLPARIRLRSGGEIKGTVARIERQSNPVTRELEVAVAFEKTPERFAIDQEAEVSILTGEAKGLCVPASAVITNKMGKRGVMIVRAGKAQFMPVETGVTDGHRVIVLKGLSKDDLVITSPQITNGKRVRVQGEA